MTHDLLAIARAALLTPSPLERYHPGAAAAVREGVGLFAGGSPEPDRNYAAVLGGSPSPERVCAVADAFFAGRADGYTITVEAEARHPIEDDLRARGWQVAEEEPMLVLAPLPAPPRPPAELVIRRVTGATTLTDWFAVSEARDGDALAPPGDGEQSRASILRQIIPSLDAALDPDVALFVGYVAGRPAATSRMSRLESTIDIMGVVTLPAWRRRGFGTAMTWAAVAAGAALGCTAAVLTATEMGYPVYLKMGFVPVCTLRTYEAT